jgi:transposase-like protein
LKDERLSHNTMSTHPAPYNLKKPPPKPTGPCSLGDACSAPTQELTDLYKCRHCSKQLHGFSSGCSTPKNPNDFRAGVICSVQPCGREIEGAAVAAAAGLPQFLWETQRSKRQRKDPQAPKLKRQRYTKEMKQLILQTLDTSPPGTTLADVAKQFQIPPGTLRGWRDELAKTQPPATDDPGTEPITEQILDPVPDSTFRIEVVPPADATTDPPRLVLVPNVPGGDNGEGAQVSKPQTMQVLECAI